MLMATGAAMMAAACGDGEDGGTATPGATGSPATLVATGTTAPGMTATATPTATVTPTATQTPRVSPAAGSTPTATPSPTATPGAGPIGEAAKEALARWLGPAGDPASIMVVSVRRQNWANGCLELPRLGEACTEAIVEGYRVELGLGRAIYELRTDAAASAFRWKPATEFIATVTGVGPNVLLLTPDDGGVVEAQVILGTQFGVPPSALEVGDRVGVALVEAPQRDGLLLLWLEPAGR